MVMAAGPRTPGWAVSYRLAAVLALAAATCQVGRCRPRCPVTALVITHRRRCRERPRNGVHSQDRVPPIRTLLTTAMAPAMVRY